MPRRLLIVVTLAVTSLAFAGSAHAAGELPRLTGNAPTDLDAQFFDDHSVIGDDHLSWSPQGGTPTYANSGGQPSQIEPHDVEWQSSISVSGPGALEVCGYPAGTTGWMRAYQIAPGPTTTAQCPATAPSSAPFGWFRYIYGRHEEQLDRWHLMDIERSALVPLNPAVPMVWDNHWGTCLNFQSSALNCEANREIGGLDAGVATPTPTKTTALGEVDAQTIPLTAPTYLPDGQYQIVTLTNPYGLIKENGGAIGNVTCVTVNLTFQRDISVPGYGNPTVSVADATPATCLLPTKLDPELSGPGGSDDPMAGAESVLPCDFTGTHCWPAPYTVDAPTEGNFTAARSLATGHPAVTPRVTISRNHAIPPEVAATGLRSTPPSSVAAPAASSASLMTPPSIASRTTSPATRRAVSVAKTRTRSALRKVFGKGLSRLHVSCRLRPASASTCTVSWRKSHARYSGRIYLRNNRVNGHLRWQYRVDVTKKRKGHKTTHIRRGYRTGGSVS